MVISGRLIVHALHDDRLAVWDVHARKVGQPQARRFDARVRGLKVELNDLVTVSGSAVGHCDGGADALARPNCRSVELEFSVPGGNSSGLDNSSSIWVTVMSI